MYELEVKNHRRQDRWAPAQGRFAGRAFFNQAQVCIGSTSTTYMFFNTDTSLLKTFLTASTRGVAPGQG